MGKNDKAKQKVRIGAPAPAPARPSQPKNKKDAALPSSSEPTDSGSDFDFDNAGSDDGSDFGFEDIESFIRSQDLEGTELGKAMGVGAGGAKASGSAAGAKQDTDKDKAAAKAGKADKKNKEKEGGSVSPAKDSAGKKAVAKKPEPVKKPVAPASDEEEDSDDESGDGELDEEEAAYAMMMAEKGLVPKMGAGDEDEDDEEGESDDEDEEEDEAAIKDRLGFVPRKDINDVPALLSRLNDIRLPPELPWIEHMSIVSSTALASTLPEEAIQDDMRREQAFHDQALAAALQGKKKVLAAGVPFTRPDDYFAEMVKSDDQMERVRRNLVEEAQAIKRAEEMKRLREAKKFGKQVQVAKIQERQKQKSRDLDKIEKLKRKRGDGKLGSDDFDVSIDDAFGDEGGSPSKKQKGLPQKGAKRAAKDAKYSFGGRKKFTKSNNRESLDDMDGFDSRAMKKPFGAKTNKFKISKNKGGKGGKGGGGNKKQRPGKNKRQAGRR